MYCTCQTVVWVNSLNCFLKLIMITLFWFNYTFNLWWQESASDDHKCKTPLHCCYSLHETMIKAWFSPKTAFAEWTNKIWNRWTFLENGKNRQHNCTVNFTEVKECAIIIDYSDGNMTMINTSALFSIRNYSKSHHAHFVFLR